MEGRPLGALERYFVVNSNLGVATNLVYSSVTPPEVAINEELLESTVARLLSKYPLLRASVVDRHTRKPLFIIQDDIKVDQVLDVRNLGDDEEPSIEASFAKTLGPLRYTTDGKEVDLTAPQWRVILEKGSKGSSLTLAVAHLLADGLGITRLFQELMSGVFGTADNLKADPLPIPPIAADVIDLKPSIRFLSRLAVSELAVAVGNALPSSLQFLSRPLFPGKAFADVMKCPLAARTLSIPLDTVNQLKASGKTRGAATFHSILMTCIFAATTRVAEKHKLPLNYSVSTTSGLRKETGFESGTTGNYTGNITSYPSFSSNTPFWDTCRAYAKLIVSPAEKKIAKMRAGSVALLPDGPSKSGKMTKWEDWLENRVLLKNPFINSIQVANVGVVAGPGWQDKVADVGWAQTPSVISSALTFNAVSLQGGDLHITLQWLVGAIATEVIDDFLSLLPLVFEKAKSSEKNATFGSLCE